MKQKSKAKKKTSRKVSAKKISSNKKKQLPQKKRKKEELKKRKKRKKQNRTTKKKKSSKKRKKNIKRFFLDGLIASSITILLSVVLFSIFFQFAEVNGYGMLPNLSDKDVLLISKNNKNYRRFKLIYVKTDKEKMVQRIVGLPGESIFYQEDNLYVNGQVIEEPFILNEISYAKKSEDIYTEDFRIQDIDNQLAGGVIPKGKYLVLGDNRPFSSDSRYFGLVDEKDIIGIVKMRILPLHKMSGFQ